VKELREIGIQPDVLLCRVPDMLSEELRRKIALFTNVPYEAVISAYDIKTSIYEIPLTFYRQGLDTIVMDLLQLEAGAAELDEWQHVSDVVGGARSTVRIAVVGKYIELNDSYKSVDEALFHGGIANEAVVELVKLDSERLERLEDLGDALGDVDAVLVPGGFGSRGIEGMIRTAQYAREYEIPYFGICLGMQVMVIEHARHRMGLAEANSTEFIPDTPAPVVSLLEEQVNVKNYGGTMRLGANNSRLLPDTRIRDIYAAEIISERHRHRYEVSNQYRDQLHDSGLRVAAVTEDDALVESVEWPAHPWGVGVQFHPEFKSKPIAAHPLFRSFVAAAVEHAARSGRPSQESTGSHASLVEQGR
jgi:CTP synthase